MQTEFNPKFINLSSPILIRGESGTGKSYLARKIFESSVISKEKFITVHLASLKEDLLESELFGHRKGAFTGAVENNNGYLKETGRGTLFLDEVGELSLEAQKKLLYLLEEKKYTPVGSTQLCAFEGRIIMATNRNLEAMVREGRFREDLYFRISVFQIVLKPLSQQLDIGLLIEALFQQLKTIHHKQNKVLSPALFSYLHQRQWRGNIRELKNSLEYALIVSEGREIEIKDLPSLPETVDLKETAKASNWIHHSDDYNECLEHFEKMFFEQALEKYQGKVNLTARKLGISKTTLISKAKKYGINTLRLRADASVNSPSAAA